MSTLSKTEQIILNRLLDSYERSKHVIAPGTSNRRVMLDVAKKDLKEYRYTEIAVRDAYNEGATHLASLGLISIEWLPSQAVFSRLVLNLDTVMEAYALLGRTHPRDLARAVVQRIETALSKVSVPWIRAWGDDVCNRAKAQYKVPSFCRQNLSLLDDLLIAFELYETVAADTQTMTMRAFSSRCYHNTKHFEFTVKDEFLRIARKYSDALADMTDDDGVSWRDELAVLGIYARPELYEMSGPCRIETAKGVIDIGAAGTSGLALPAALTESIERITYEADALNSEAPDLLFIENKTNYDEFLVQEKADKTVVVYHGGFLSPGKRRFISQLVAAFPETADIRFWADIDWGGFAIFEQLQALVPTLKPWRMDAEAVHRFAGVGLKRDEAYLQRLVQARDAGRFPLFDGSIQAILDTGVTIEQEAFL